jgi:hypothetical protein
MKKIMKNIIFIIVILISNSIFSQNLNLEDEREHIIKMLDTLDYSESDFNSIKNYIKEQKGFQELASKKILEGDKNMMALVNILSLPFNQAKVKYGKKEINVLIFSHYKSREILNKFKALNEAFELELDSLEKQKTPSNKEIQKPHFPKELQEELDAYKKKMDSLKKE